MTMLSQHGHCLSCQRSAPQFQRALTETRSGLLSLWLRSCISLLAQTWRLSLSQKLKSLALTERSIGTLMKKLVFMQIDLIFSNFWCSWGPISPMTRAYSYPYTKVLGYVACWTTSKRLGVGSAERSWSDVNPIKDGKRSNLGGSSLEVSIILFTSAKLNEAQIKRLHEMMDTNDDFLATMNFSKFFAKVFFSKFFF